MSLQCNMSEEDIDRAVELAKNILDAYAAGEEPNADNVNDLAILVEEGFT